MPDPGQAVLLHKLGLLRTDELPDLASRWLAVDLIDTENIRELAGISRSDFWGIDRLFAEAIEDWISIGPDSDEDQLQVALDWVVSHWRRDHDTASAIKTLARLGESEPTLDLGFFIGLEDELQGGWGRSHEALTAEAASELNRLAR